VLEVEDLIGFKVRAIAINESPKYFDYAKKYSINGDEFQVHIKARNMLFLKGRKKKNLYNNIVSKRKPFLLLNIEEIYY